MRTDTKPVNDKHWVSLNTCIGSLILFDVTLVDLQF